MYLLLTDVLACPECGPDHGLVLLAEDVQDRRVMAGELGCPNCERRFPIRVGIADFRRAGQKPAPVPDDLEEQPLRVAALMGVAEGPASVLLCGAAIEVAAGVAALVPKLEVALADSVLEGTAETAGVSRLRVDERLPFYAASLRAVALFGAAVAPRLPEAVRVLHPTGRIVVMGAELPSDQELSRLGVQVIAREGSTAVLKRS